MQELKTDMSEEVTMSEIVELTAEVRQLREAMERSQDVHDRYSKPLTREQAAEYLSIHPDTLYRWAVEGRVAYSRLGDGERAPMRFLKEDLDEYARNQRIPTVEEAKTRL